MIRYVVSFPPEVHFDQEQYERISDLLKVAGSSAGWKDIVLTHGGTIKDMRPGRNPKPVWVKNVQRRLR